MLLQLISKDGSNAQPLYSTKMRQWPKGFLVRYHLGLGILEFIDQSSASNLRITAVQSGWENTLSENALAAMCKWHLLGVLTRTPEGTFHLADALNTLVELYASAYTEQPPLRSVTPAETEWLVGMMDKEPQDRTLEEAVLVACTYPNMGPFGRYTLPVMGTANGSQTEIDRALLGLIKKGYLRIRPNHIEMYNRFMFDVVPGTAARILYHEAQHREIVEGAKCLAKVLDSVDGQ